MVLPLAQQTHLRMRTDILIDDLTCAVHRAIVNDNNLEFIFRHPHLINAIKAAYNEVSSIEYWNYERQYHF